MTRVVDLDGPGLDWREVVMPASSGPVRLVRLHAAGEASVSLVRFPAGWSRPDTGHYSCAEEFVVLDGLISVSGTDFPAGTYAYLPPSTPRTASVAGPGGCLAVAWFSGPPAWKDGLPDGPAPRVVHGPVAEALRVEDDVIRARGSASGVQEPRGLVSGGDVEVLSLTARTWTYGSGVPGLPGPLLTRFWPTA
ncbi:cupin domain-containing protein [Nonomuraea harbinensis]|uniref:Cupin domain-containing protein n=1 Tax=Nonomuraea harbinensis TaxID=1286938 RepID=A0ABW1BU89_9ACTN|nr:cupin domain-containing protein [Nonomuraea harbinensis]